MFRTMVNAERPAPKKGNEFFRTMIMAGRRAQERENGVEWINETSALFFSQSLAPTLKGRAWVAMEVDDGANWAHFSMPHDSKRYLTCKRAVAEAV